MQKILLLVCILFVLVKSQNVSQIISDALGVPPNDPSLGCFAKTTCSDCVTDLGCIWGFDSTSIMIYNTTYEFLNKTENLVFCLPGLAALSVFTQGQATVINGRTVFTTVGAFGYAFGQPMLCTIGTDNLSFFLVVLIIFIVVVVAIIALCACLCITVCVCCMSCKEKEYD